MHRVRAMQVPLASDAGERKFAGVVTKITVMAWTAAAFRLMTYLSHLAPDPLSRAFRLGADQSPRV